MGIFCEATRIVIVLRNGHVFCGWLFNETLHNKYMYIYIYVLDHILCLYRSTVQNAGGGDLLYVIYLIYVILIFLYIYIHIHIFIQIFPLILILLWIKEFYADLNVPSPFNTRPFRAPCNGHSL